MDAHGEEDQPDGKKFKRNYSAGKSGIQPNLGLGDSRIEYFMGHKHRGICLVLNNKNFSEVTRQAKRSGTDKDAKDVVETFKNLGFHTERRDDTKRADMMQTLNQISQMDHSDHDCFVCVILSHGIQEKIYSTDTMVPIEDIVAPFKGTRCKTLIGKPKIFFIQACRGMQFDRGVEETDSAVDDKDAPAQTRKIPVEADFFMAYSTVPGYYSWRNSEDGSWFIQSLIKVLKEHAAAGQVEFHHLMIVVNRLVALENESCTHQPDSHGMKQIPSIVSMLTKLLYFRADRLI